MTTVRKKISPTKLEHERKIRGISSREKLAQLLEEKFGGSISVSALRLWDREGWPLDRYLQLLSVLQISRRHAEKKLFLTDAEKRLIKKYEGKNEH